MTLDINGRTVTLGNHARTLGDLIECVDERLADTGDVMTAVRLDGVDEVAFRDPIVCGQALSAFSTIQVETASPQVLARQCLEDAALALASLSQATRAAADGFRGADVGQARTTLEQISQGLMAVLHIVSAAGPALPGAFDGPDSRFVDSLSTELDRIVGDLVAAQQNEDWIQVADVLEYDLGPALNGWRNVLTDVAAA